MTVADYDIFKRRQAFQSYRPTRMQLVGTDTNLCAETVLNPVRKTTRGIDHHRTGIDFMQKTLRPRQ
jgi:hypothetical protein